MKKKETAVFDVLQARYPGLVEKVRGLIEGSERRFTGRSGKQDSYLWEHTTHVASLAFDLANAEKMDPVVPAVAALFHDAGKFMDGTYHAGRRTEEDDAARLAGPVLRGAGMKPRDIRRVAFALRALYDARAGRDAVAGIVHDADFLSKFGALGVAQFFIKSTLRGQNLRHALMRSLSKELTYAAGLPGNMRTKAGKRLAERKSAETLRFFRSLMRELRETRIADVVVKRVLVEAVSRPGRPIMVRLAIPRVCDSCGGRWTIAHLTERGTKCEKLEVEIICARCGECSSFSFCLPEVPPRVRRIA